MNPEHFQDAQNALPKAVSQYRLPACLLQHISQFDSMNAIERSYVALQKGKVDTVSAMVYHVVKEVDHGDPVVVREVKI
jgi:hypothetical protein